MSDYVVALGGVCTFEVNTHHPTTGAETDADSAPTFRIYADGTDTPVATGTMTKQDDSNTIGLYKGQVTCSGPTFAINTIYHIRVHATVAAITQNMALTMAIEKTLSVNMVQINGTSIAGTSTQVADSFVALFNTATRNFTLASQPQTGDTYARVGAPIGASISADVAAIRASVTGGNYALATDGSGFVKVSSGTGSGQLSITSGLVALTSAYDPAKTAAQAADWTSARAAKIDNLDVVLSTRLATSGYTAPNNSGISSILTKVSALALDGSGFVGISPGTGSGQLSLSAGAVILQSAYDAAKTAAAPGAAMTLTSAYDAAKNAASGVEWTPTRAAKVDNLDVTISSRASATALAVLGTVFTGITSLGAWLRAAFRADAADATALTEINLGGGTFNPATMSLQFIGSEGSGVGPYTVTITAKDAAGASINGVAIRIAQGLVSWTAKTDINGRATFGVTTGAWSLVAYIPGYEFTPSSFNVTNADVARTVVGAVSTIPATSDPFHANVQFYCYGTDGQLATNVQVQNRLITMPPGVGMIVVNDTVTRISGSAGTVLFTNLWRRGYYQVRARPSDDAPWGDWLQYEVPSAALNNADTLAVAITVTTNVQP